MDDVTQRLRVSSNPEQVDRERYMASSLFSDAMHDSSGNQVSDDQMKRLARQSIAAACTFWEEWDIATLAPDVKIEEWP